MRVFASHGVVRNRNRQAEPAKRKENAMKNMNRISFVAVFAAILTLAFNARADGIAASPKVLQMMNERAATHSVVSGPVYTVSYSTPGPEAIAASPKVRQMLADRRVVVSGVPTTEVVSAGYKPTGPDGVTASPKVRSQLNERSTPIMIAPLK